MEKTELTFAEKVTAVQNELNAPKSLYNKFGGYSYRNIEDIYNGLKPLLKQYGLMLAVSDTIVEVGGKNYIKAVARLTDGVDDVQVQAFAREADSQKGMNEAQLTGSTSSYARKYCLGGLFLIDDCIDEDTLRAEQEKKEEEMEKALSKIEKDIADINNINELRAYYNTLSKEEQKAILPKFQAKAVELQ